MSNFITSVDLRPPCFCFDKSDTGVTI